MGVSETQLSSEETASSVPEGTRFWIALILGVIALASLAGVIATSILFGSVLFAPFDSTVILIIGSGLTSLASLIGSVGGLVILVRSKQTKVQTAE